MNVFVTCSGPRDCAEALDDHTLKQQIKECYHLLMMGERFKDATDHPMLLWLRSSRSNAHWLFAYGMYLGEELAKRLAELPLELAGIEALRGGLHLYPDTRQDQSDESKEPEFPTSFLNASDHPDVQNVHLAYRMTLNDRWDNAKDRPVWSNRKPPEWARWKSVRQDFKRTDTVVTRYHYRQKDQAVRFGDEDAG